MACLSERLGTAAAFPYIMWIEAIGWLSSLVLVCTISKQVYNQWSSGTSQGVSKWLFIGQLLASTGFLAYSAALRSWVFIATNALLLLGAAAGLGILLHHRRRERHRHVRLPGPKGRILWPQRREVPWMTHAPGAL